MLFDAPPERSDQDGRLLHWLLRGGLLGILLLCSGYLLPSRWERLYHLMCPLANSETAYAFGLPFSLAGAIAWMAFIISSQFVIYGVIALGIGVLTGVIRNRFANVTSPKNAAPSEEE